jgi:hypothetical protein
VIYLVLFSVVSNNTKDTELLTLLFILLVAVWVIKTGKTFVGFYKW